MKSFGKALAYGLLAWLIPFVVAFSVFIFHESNRALFESVMAVAVAGTAILCGLLYMRRIPNPGPKDGLYVGLLWWIVCVLIDLPMITAGPMEMSFGAYMADIGLTYVAIPVITLGLGIAFGHSVLEEEPASA